MCFYAVWTIFMNIVGKRTQSESCYADIQTLRMESSATAPRMHMHGSRPIYNLNDSFRTLSETSSLVFRQTSATHCNVLPLFRQLSSMFRAVDLATLCMSTAASSRTPGRPDLANEPEKRNHKSQIAQIALVTFSVSRVCNSFSLLSPSYHDTKAVAGRTTVVAPS